VLWVVLLIGESLVDLLAMSRRGLAAARRFTAVPGGRRRMRPWPAAGSGCRRCSSRGWL